MSFIICPGRVLVAAAAKLHGIGSALGAANAAAAAPLTAIVSAGADEVSAAVAALFSAHAQDYRELSVEAAVFHDRFAQALTAGAGSYASAEASSADALDDAFALINTRPSCSSGAR